MPFGSNCPRFKIPKKRLNSSNITSLNETLDPNLNNKPEELKKVYFLLDFYSVL